MAYKKTGITRKGKIVEFETKVNGEPKKYEIREPNEEQAFLAFKHIIKSEPDLLSAGKVIFETCCVGYDEEIRTDRATFVNVCLELQAEYVAISGEEIKKKAAE